MSESAQVEASPASSAASQGLTSLTPVASMLMGRNPLLSLKEHAGLQSPALFSDPAEELSTLLHSVGLHDLGFRTRISVTGEDKFRWLNGMVTNAVTTLAEGHGNYNFILNAQGRIQGDAYVFREADRLVIETDRSQVAPLLEHFDRFIIMDDVELKELSATQTAVGVSGPGAAELLGQLGLPEAAGLEALQFSQGHLGGVEVTVVCGYSELIPHFELWFSLDRAGAVWDLLSGAGAVPTGIVAHHALRILEGVPLYGVDIHDRSLVQETSQTRALNFTKGCYLGQEIVERIRSRTTVHRFLRQLQLTGVVPVPGAELRSPGEERPVGQLTSVASYSLSGLPETLALGFVRGEAIDRGFPIEYEGGTATVLDAPPKLP